MFWSNRANRWLQSGRFPYTQTGKLITLRLVDFLLLFCSVPIVPDIKLVSQKRFFPNIILFRLYASPDISPPPPVRKRRALTWGFTVAVDRQLNSISKIELDGFTSTLTSFHRL